MELTHCAGSCTTIIFLTVAGTEKFTGLQKSNQQQRI